MLITKSDASIMNLENDGRDSWHFLFKEIDLKCLTFIYADLFKHYL